MSLKNKGEMTTASIVGVIILILSIVIIFFFVRNLNLGKVTASEVCHYSVVMRSTAISANDVLKNTVPLNCKTQYVCLSKDGTCEKLTSPEIKKVKTKEEVYDVLANQLADCWWMFGEGNVNYAGKDLKSSIYCSICSQIVFDDSVDMFNSFQEGELLRQIDNNEFYGYLQETNLPGKDLTYWNYLYDLGNPEELKNVISQDQFDNTNKIVSMCNSFCEVEDVDSFCLRKTELNTPEVQAVGTCYALSKAENYGVNECLKFPCEMGDEKIDFKSKQEISESNLGIINLDNLYYLIMGVADNIDVVRGAIIGSAVSTGVVGVASVILIVSTGGTAAIPIGAILVANAVGATTGGATGFMMALVSKGTTGQQFIHPTLIDANSKEYESLKCTDVNTLA